MPGYGRRSAATAIHLIYPLIYSWGRRRRARRLRRGLGSRPRHHGHGRYRQDGGRPVRSWLDQRGVGQRGVGQRGFGRAGLDRGWPSGGWPDGNWPDGGSPDGGWLDPRGIGIKEGIRDCSGHPGCVDRHRGDRGATTGGACDTATADRRAAVDQPRRTRWALTILGVPRCSPHLVPAPAPTPAPVLTRRATSASARSTVGPISAWSAWVSPGPRWTGWRSR